jgi:hypothetical protein
MPFYLLPMMLPAPEEANWIAQHFGDVTHQANDGDKSKSTQT